MKTKLTFLLSLTFLFLFSGSVYGDEPVDKQYWDDGKLKWETYYDEEREKGLGVGWYKSGKKEVEVHYNVSQEGEQLSLKEDGQLNTWYKNGNRKSMGFYKEGKVEGLETTWYESGNKIEEYRYKNGELDGEQTKWHESGIKQTTRYYKNGIENGLRTEWAEDGKKTFQGNFVDGYQR